jgi:hypothetical protein
LVNKDNRDRYRKVSIFAAIETALYEKLVENCFKTFGKKKKIIEYI